MKKSVAGFVLFLSGVLIIMISECTPETCYEETEAYLKATFYRIDELDITYSTPEAPDSITVFGPGKEDDKIYDRSENIETALLPLDPAARSTVFVIRINGITDTLQISHNNYPHLISKECGYTFYFNIDSAYHTSNAIFTIETTNSTVTTIYEENIRIFY